MDEDSVENGLIYTKQKVQTALAKGEMSRVDADFNALTPEEKATYFKQWNSNKLQNFVDGYNSCLSVLMSGNFKLEFDPEHEGEPNPDPTIPESYIATELYKEYRIRYDLANEALTEIQAQIKVQDDIINPLIGYEYKDSYGRPQTYKGQIQQFQESMAFAQYLKDYYGDTSGSMYKKYRAYIREDTYQNQNYISDTKETTEESIEVAQELLSVAEGELKKACVLQRTMQVNLKNLLALPEFESLYDSFELFNYIRVRTEDEILKLRLIGVEYSGDDMSSIEVTFSDQIESVDGSLSDLESILNQAKSIATSYKSTVKQAQSGTYARNYVQETIDYGLNAASTMLKNSDENEITITESGIIAKRMDDQGFYGDKQLRIIGNGMYMTTNAWKSVEMAVGEILFVDPRYPESDPVWKYGVIADALVGNLIVGQNMYIGNENGSVEINGNGIILTKGTIMWSEDPEEGINPPSIEDISSLNVVLNDLVDDVYVLDDTINTYNQDTDPSLESGWIPQDHISDIWFNTATGVVKVYTKTGNVYSWEDTNNTVLKALAEEKSTIFMAQPSTKDKSGYIYRKGDLWILIADTTVGGVAYKKDTILTTTNSRTDQFVPSDWIPATTKAATDFASDSVVTVGEKIQLKYTMMDIVQEYNEISAQAAKYTVSIADLTTVYNTLYNYMYNTTNGILHNMNENSNVTPSTYQTNFSNYYTKRKDAEVIIENARASYSDGQLQEFITNTYTPYVQQAQTQIDAKITSYYQASKPYADQTNVTPTTELDAKVGDLWYETSTGKTYSYQKTNGTTSGKYNYTWTFEDVPDAVFDLIDGKKNIYVVAPTTDVDGDGYLYRKGDMWIISSADRTSSNVTVRNLASQYSVNTILASSVDRAKTSSFTPSDWSLLTTESAEQALSDIADMGNDGKLTPVEKIQTKRRLAEIDDEKAVYQARKNAYPSDSSVTSVYSTYETKYNALKTQSTNWGLDSDTTTDITDSSFKNYFSQYYTAKEALDSALEAASKKYAEDQANAVDGKLDAFKSTVNSTLNTTVIGSDYIISPMIGGGYLYLVSGSGSNKSSVEINPVGSTIKSSDGSTTSGNIIRVSYHETDVFKVDTAGNATFRGTIYASAGSFTGTITSTSGQIGGWKIDDDSLFLSKDDSSGGTEEAFIHSSGYIEFAYEQNNVIKNQVVFSRDGIYIYDTYGSKNGSALIRAFFDVEEMTLDLTCSNIYLDGKTGIGDDLSVDGNCNISGNLIISQGSNITGNLIGNVTGKASSAAQIDNSSIAGYHASAHYFQTTDALSWATCYAAAFVPQASSKTVKKNIKDLEESEANKLLKLHPVKFDFKNEKLGTDCYGLIAEEVAEVGIDYPILPSIMPDTKEEVPALDYTRFIPYIIKVIQMQQNEIDYLKSQLSK